MGNLFRFQILIHPFLATIGAKNLPYCYKISEILHRYIHQNDRFQGFFLIHNSR